MPDYASPDASPAPGAAAHPPSPDIPALPVWSGQVPDAHEVLRNLAVVQLRLAVPFRGLTVREVALVRGPAGWAEFSPFTEYDDAEASAWLAHTIDTGWHGWPDPVRDVIGVNATVPAVTVDQVPSVLARFPGARTAKVKVAERGHAVADDVARVAAVRAALGPEAKIRVDANMGWTVAQATQALAALEPFNLEYAEQPCPGIEGLIALRKALSDNGITVPLAADEAIRKADDPFAVAAASAADVAVLKVPPLGGPSRTLAIAELITRNRADGGVGAAMTVAMSSALDSEIGVAAGVATAAALPDLNYDNGLATSQLFIDHVCEPLAVSGGQLQVPRQAQVTPDPSLLARHAADAERTRWWTDRIRRCLELLDDAAWAQRDASAVGGGRG